jgi:hypothetical protein
MAWFHRQRVAIFGRMHLNTLSPNRSLASSATQMYWPFNGCMSVAVFFRWYRSAFRSTDLTRVCKQ